MIRRVTLEDAHDIARIYNHYILNTTVTFEEQPVTSQIMSQRIKNIQTSQPWIVLKNDSHIQGYAYLGPYHTRCSFRYTWEVSIYLDHTQCTKGLGTTLMTELLHLMNKDTVHTLIGSIALPNEPSVRLHEKFGFKKVGHMEQVGFKFGHWIDVGYWEKICHGSEQD